MAKRSRTTRRELERELARLGTLRERAFALSVGGSRDRPIDVSTSAVIEGRAASAPCPRCEGRLRVEEHAAERGLRVVRATCLGCHSPRELWFRIVTDEPN